MAVTWAFVRGFRLVHVKQCIWLTWSKLSIWLGDYGCMCKSSGQSENFCQHVDWWLVIKSRSCDQRLGSNFWHYARQNIAQSLTISTTSVMTSLVDGRWDRATAHATANTHASNVTSCVHLCAPHDTPPVLRSVHHIVSRHRHSPWRHVSAVIKLGMSSNQVWFEICTHELCLQ